MSELFLYVLTCSVFFLVLTGGAVCARAAGVTGSSAKALPFWLFTLMALQYALSAFGAMQAGPVVILVLSAGLWAYAIVKSIREKRCPLDPGFFLYAAVFAVLCFGNYGRRVQFADEFNHWAAVVKVMCEQGLLSSSAAANLSHASYPPAMAMLQYLPERILHLIDGTRLYSEQYLYVAYQAAVAAIPFFAVSMLPRERKPLQKLPCALLITISLFVFAPRLVRFIMIDGYMGLVLGLGAILILESDGSGRYVYAFSGLCFVMTLLKNTGILYTVLLVLIALIAERGGKRRLPLWGAVSGAAAFGSWQLLLKLGGATSKFDLSLDMLRTDRGTFLREILGAYLKTTFTTGLSASADALLSPVWPLVMLVFVLLALFIRRRTECSRRDRTVFTMLFISALLLYVAMPFAYAYIFPEADAMRGWDRYISVPLSAMLLMTCYALCRPADSRAYRFPAVSLAVLCLLCFPYKEPARLLTRHEAGQSAAFAREFDAADGLISSLPVDEKVMILEEGGKNGNEKHALRYLALPREVEFVDAGGKGHYRMRLPSFETEADAFAGYMSRNGFSYLLVFHGDDAFTKDFASLFDGPDAIRDNTLYALENGRLKAV